MPIERLNKKTGLYTQEILEILMFHEIARVERYPIPLAIIRIAAEYTNKPVYEVIEGAKMAVAHILSSNLRVADVPGHYENDYILLLPVTDEPGAKVVAGRINKLLFGHQPLRNGGQLDLIPFMGIASIPQGAIITVDDFVARATIALNEARRRAPGSIVAYSEVGI
jgi:GGDEF domain-containing protein